MAERFLAFLGYIGYGLYLVHVFVFWEFDGRLRSSRFGDDFRNPAWIFATAIVYAAVAVAIAYVSRRYFEELFLRLKDAHGAKKKASVQERPTESVAAEKAR